jgi:hypothetical protein
LRPVDDREPLVELLQIFGGALLGFFQRIAEAMGNRIEPLVDAVGELRLSLRQHSDHRLKARSGIGLRARQLRHGGFVAGPFRANAKGKSPSRCRHSKRRGRPGRRSKRFRSCVRLTRFAAASG